MLYSYFLPLADIAFDDVPETGVSLPMMIAAGVAVLVLILFVAFVFLRPKPKPVAQEESLRIDVSTLSGEGPPSEGPKLQLFSNNVRLAVMIMAPVGKNSVLPPKEMLRDICEAVVPGLAGVLDVHKPIYRSWPAQLSIRGFIQTAFNKLVLPGDAGKGTPWSTVAGVAEWKGHRFLLALVVCAADNNQVGQEMIEQPARWRDLLRVQS